MIRTLTTRRDCHWLPGWAAERIGDYPPACDPDTVHGTADAMPALPDGPASIVAAAVADRRWAVVVIRDHADGALTVDARRDDGTTITWCNAWHGSTERAAISQLGNPPAGAITFADATARIHA